MKASYSCPKTTEVSIAMGVKWWVEDMRPVYYPGYFNLMLEFVLFSSVQFSSVQFSSVQFSSVPVQFMYFSRVTKVQISSSDDILHPRGMDHDVRRKVQSVSQVHSSLYKSMYVTPIPD